MDILGILKIEFHIEETPIADENNCDEDYGDTTLPERRTLDLRV